MKRWSGWIGVRFIGTWLASLSVSWSLENTDSPNFFFFSFSLVAYAVEIGYHPFSVREKKQLQVA